MRPKKLDSFGVHIFMGRGLFLLQEKINTIFKATALWKKYLSFDTLSKIARKTRFYTSDTNKNKTNPRENLEFVFSFQASRDGSLGSFGLFFVRDYFGLSVKFRIIKGEILSRPLLYASDFLIISSYRLSIPDLLYFLNFISISR